jgi:hypothetical protein
MTITRRILEILSFVVHFRKESSKSYVSIIVLQSELSSVNLLFIFFHKKKKLTLGYFIRRIQVFG